MKPPFEIGSVTKPERFPHSLRWPPSQTLMRQLEELDFTDQEVADLCQVSASDVNRLRQSYVELGQLPLA